MKTCTDCKREKPLAEFAKNGKYFRNKCKLCTRPQVNSWYVDNREKHLSNTAKWASENKDKRKVIGSTYRENNIDVCRERARNWQKKNPDKVNAIVAKRRATKRNATPAWLTKGQEDDIKAMYALAKKFEKLCNVEYHVDHIVPLAGKDICGLHVPWNLQLLPASINLAKGNRYNGKETLRGRS